MITVTINAPAIHIVDLSDHPALHGVRVHGRLVLPPLGCASVNVLGRETRWCSPPVIDLDVTEPLTCGCGDCSVALSVKGEATGTLVIEPLTNTAFVPLVVQK